LERPEQEKTMQLITTYELKGRTEIQLSALYAAAIGALVRSEPETPERRNALATLENITRARISLTFKF
jgi:hypothetical protein